MSVTFSPTDSLIKVQTYSSPNIISSLKTTLHFLNAKKTIINQTQMTQYLDVASTNSSENSQQIYMIQ
jgi:hypothetical protein